MSTFCKVYYRHCCQNVEGLGGRFRSFQFGGIFESCSPGTYGIVGSFKSESIVTIYGSCDALDDIEITSRVSLPDISVDLRTIGVFCLGRLGSLDDCSSKNTGELIELVDIVEDIFKLQNSEKIINISIIAANE